MISNFSFLAERISRNHAARGHGRHILEPLVLKVPMEEAVGNLLDALVS